MVNNRLSNITNVANSKPSQWQQLSRYIDFLSPQNRYRCRHASRKNALLARAIGIKAGNRPLAIDATAGFGSDAQLIAALGCRVVMLERCSSLAELLRQALANAKDDAEMGETAARMRLIEVDSITFLKNRRYEEKPDVIYLDPMFPPRKKTALVKKSLQTLQTLLGGETTDAAELLQAAIDCAPKRVVVKRPLSAAALDASIVPSLTMKGRSCRFDIYLSL
ncbi:MAG: class I SAM-dependent methyltransferase [Gammaproteobacteria bacterium]|nr:class I SAM-dependent methyltransferase [Gammaproteobacteria bacterium]